MCVYRDSCMCVYRDSYMCVYGEFTARRHPRRQSLTACMSVTFFQAEARVHRLCAGTIRRKVLHRKGKLPSMLERILVEVYRPMGEKGPPLKPAT